MACAMATAIAGCSWMMVKPPDDGAHGPAAVCTETQLYEGIDLLYGGLAAIVAVLYARSLLDPDSPTHHMAQTEFPMSATAATALLWSGETGMRDTARCRAVHAQR
jgi:hypothetical protein